MMHPCGRGAGQPHLLRARRHQRPQPKAPTAQGAHSPRHACHRAESPAAPPAAQDGVHRLSPCLVSSSALAGHQPDPPHRPGVPRARQALCRAELGRGPHPRAAAEEVEPRQGCARRLRRGVEGDAHRRPQAPLRVIERD
eukprot:2562530-Prymnesium_polylepis.1